MRVLYIAHTSGEGGSTIALLNLIKGLKTKDVEIAVICPTDGYLVDELKNIGIQVFVPQVRYVGYNIYPLTKNPFKWCRTMLGDFYRTIKGEKYISQIIKSYNPDIVHSNSTACVAGYNVCKRLGIKHVWHVREFLEIGFGWIPKPSIRVHRNRITDLNTYKIAITKAIYDHYDMKDPNEYIYDGVINSNEQIQIQSELKSPFFLFVGALTKGKGIDILVHQFIEFHKTNKTHHLVIIGPLKDEELISCLKNEIEKADANKYVHWMGMRRDVYSWMSCASALIVPSIQEGFGFITAEAMYCKTIVIGRNTAGTKEQFDIGLVETGKEIGIRFNIDSELPMMMKYVVSNDLTTTKENAYKTVCRHYTIEIHANNVYNFYNKIMTLCK